MAADSAQTVNQVSEIERPQREPPLRIAIRWGLMLGVFGLLLWLAVRTIDVAQVATALRRSDWRLVVAAGLLAVTVCLVSCSYRLWILTVPLPTSDGRRIGFWHFTSVYYASCAAHQLLPAPAAEVLRTVHLKRRHGYTIGGLVASQFVEKVIEALALALEVGMVAAFSSLPPRMIVIHRAMCWMRRISSAAWNAATSVIRPLGAI